MPLLVRARVDQHKLPIPRIQDIGAREAGLHAIDSRAQGRSRRCSLQAAK